MEPCRGQLLHSPVAASPCASGWTLVRLAVPSLCEHHRMGSPREDTEHMSPSKPTGGPCKGGVWLDEDSSTSQLGSQPRGC